MSLQLSDTMRNAQADLFESTLGASAILKIRTGPPPANVAASRTGIVLATITLPSDWMTAASSGAKSKSGTWSDASADASGLAGHAEFTTSGGTVHAQMVAAGPWAASTAYVVGDTITNDSGKVYRCDTNGTSASSGGPTGTGANITDGTTQWDYVQAAADLILDNGRFAAGQQVDISTFTYTQLGA